MPTCFLWRGKQNASLGFILLRCHCHCWRSLLSSFQRFLLRPGNQNNYHKQCDMIPYFSFHQGLLFRLATKEVLSGVEANGNPFVFIFLVQGFNDLAQKVLHLASSEDWIRTLPRIGMYWVAYRKSKYKPAVCFLLRFEKGKAEKATFRFCS